MPERERLVVEHFLNVGHADIQGNQTVSGHRIDVGVVRRDLMHLLCIYLAREPLISERSYGAPLQQLFEDFDWSETTRLLLHVAALLRIMADCRQFSLDAISDTEDPSLGSIKVVAKNGKVRRSNLSLREACNKLIHAREVTLQPIYAPPVKDMDSAVERKYLESGVDPDDVTEDVRICPRVILLNGEWKGEWTATIDIVEFIGKGTTLARWSTTILEGRKIVVLES